MHEIVDELNLDLVLTGAVQIYGDEVHVSARLTRGDDLTSIWTNEFDGRMSEPFALQSLVTDRIIDELPFELTVVERRRLRTLEAADPRAEVAYLQGRYFAPWAGRVEHQMRALSYFEQAIAIDPNYTLAYCGLIDTKCYLATWGNLAASPVRDDLADMIAGVLQRYGSIAAVHDSAGNAALWLTWDWDSAEAAFERAIELNANTARFYDDYARMLAIVGRYDEAVEQFREAIEWNPTSSSHFSGQGMLYAGLGRLEEAEEFLQKALELDEMNPEAAVWLAYSRQQQGEYDEAVRIMEESVSLVEEPELAMRAFLGFAYALAGRLDDARGQLAEMERAKSEVPDHYLWFAELHAAMGETEEAFRLLDQALEAGQAWLIHVRFDPGSMFLRDDPRFAELHRRMGLGHVDLDGPSLPR